MAGSSLECCYRDWSSLPSGVLLNVLAKVLPSSDLVPDTPALHDVCAARSVCRAWRSHFDSARKRLRLRTWPHLSQRPVFSTNFSDLTHVDLQSLELEQLLARGPSRPDVMPARHGSSRPLPPLGAHGVPRALGLPLQTPCAVEQIWDDLPNLQQLLSLSLSPAMLDIVGRSCNLSVVAAGDGCSGFAYIAPPSDGRCLTIQYQLKVPQQLQQLSQLRQLSIDWHLPIMQAMLYSRDAEAVLCSTYQQQVDVVGASNSSSSGTSGATSAEQFSPVCSTSVDGAWCWVSASPSSSSSCSSSSTSLLVRHCSTGQVTLPAQFAALRNLSDITLSGHMWGADTLMPLQQLPGVTRLVLGPGQINLGAVTALGDAWLGRLAEVGLSQEAGWQLAQLKSLLAATKQLKELTVEEVESCRAYNPLFGSPPSQMAAAAAAGEAAAAAAAAIGTAAAAAMVEAAAVAGLPSSEGASLEAADFQHLASSLTSLTWRASCSRCNRGAALLQSCGLPWIAPLQGLRRLVVEGLPSSNPGGPYLTSLDASLLACSSLEQLRVVNLGVPELPMGLSSMRQLRAVTIEPGAAGVRPFSDPSAALAPLGACSQLLELRLVGCELRTLPSWLTALSALQVLSLQGNQLKQLGEGAAAMGLPTSLQQLDLADNRICALPSSVSQLPQLQVLILDNNYLSGLPRQVWRLQELQVLSVARNMLSALPEVPCVHPAPPHSTPNSPSRSSSSSSRPSPPPSPAAAAAAVPASLATSRQTAAAAAPASYSSSSAPPPRPTVAAVPPGPHVVITGVDSDDDLAHGQGPDQQAVSWAESAGLSPAAAAGHRSKGPWSNTWRQQHITVGAAIRASSRYSLAAGSRRSGGAGVRGSGGVGSSSAAAAAGLSGGGQAGLPYSVASSTSIGSLSSTRSSSSSSGSSSSPGKAGPPGRPNCCRSLRVLVVDHNQLNSLPASLGQLRALQVLQLRHNHLHNLPSSCMAGLQQLVYCSVAGNHLQKLPSCLSRLPLLAVLNVDSNHLVEVPRWLRVLPCVVGLDVQSEALGGHRCALKMLLLGLREIAVAVKDIKSAAALRQSKGWDVVKGCWKASGVQLVEVGRAPHQGMLGPVLGHSVEVAGFKLPMV